jgi:hypothetical protein
MKARGVDISPQFEFGVHNSGFMAVMPTPGAIRLFTMMLNVSAADPTAATEQVVMNNCIKRLNTSLTVNRLRSPRFDHGLHYFRWSKRNFATADQMEQRKTCRLDNCTVVVHATYVITRAAKVRCDLLLTAVLR